ncbi:MAG: sugar ABC transporter permease [Eubacteriales bacterium]|nr:sugar ABC transporter permease [Eubacteriales bacterium]
MTNSAISERDLRARQRYDRKEISVAYLFLLPLLVGIIIFFIVPIVETFYYSFTSWKGVGVAKWTGIANYIKMFSKDKKFGLEISNTFAFVFGSVPLTLMIAIVIASMMNARIKAVGFFRVIYFLPNVTMVAVVVMIWRWLLNSEYGIVDLALNSLFGIRPAWMSDTNLTMLSMCLISVWSGVGYCIVILLSGLQSISPTYYEAATIDGANGIQQFFKITLPLVTPTLFFLLVTRVIGAFNQFDMVYLMADNASSGAVGPVVNSLRTLVFGVYQSAFADMQMGYACAKAVFLFFVILVVTVVQMIGEKRWVNY